MDAQVSVEQVVEGRLPFAWIEDVIVCCRDVSEVRDALWLYGRVQERSP